MPKYWGKQIFSLGSFPKVGQKQKTENREKERLKVYNNNGLLHIANATSCGARKAPGPICCPWTDGPIDMPMHRTAITAKNTINLVKIPSNLLYFKI